MAGRGFHPLPEYFWKGFSIPSITQTPISFAKSGENLIVFRQGLKPLRNVPEQDKILFRLEISSPSGIFLEGIFNPFHHSRPDFPSQEAAITS